MIIISDKKILDLNVKESLYVKPAQFEQIMLDKSKKFILYFVDNLELFNQHLNTLQKFKKKVILIADYSNLETYEAIKNFHAFLLVDKKEGISMLNKFIAISGSYITESIQKSLEACQTQIRDLEGQLGEMIKMIQELSQANVEFLVNQWSEDDEDEKK